MSLARDVPRVYAAKETFYIIHNIFLFGLFFSVKGSLLVDCRSIALLVVVIVFVIL